MRALARFTRVEKAYRRRLAGAHRARKSGLLPGQFPESGFWRGSSHRGENRRVDWSLAAGLHPLHRPVRVAFVYGSLARGDEQPTSDIDLMIVGDVDLAETSAALARAQKTLGREINETVYPEPEFVSKRKARNHFINSVLAAPKLFVIGDEHELAKLGSKRLAAAAQN